MAIPKGMTDAQLLAYAARQSKEVPEEMETSSDDALPELPDSIKEEKNLLTLSQDTTDTKQVVRLSRRQRRSKRRREEEEKILPLTLEQKCVISATVGEPEDEVPQYLRKKLRLYRRRKRREANSMLRSKMRFFSLTEGEPGTSRPGRKKTEVPEPLDIPIDDLIINEDKAENNDIPIEELSINEFSR